MLKRLLNFPESVTNQRLREVCSDFDAKVYAKVRVADVVPIEGSGIDNSHYTYALQSHFDFVVVDSDYQPLFAVEFDGSSHSSPEVQKRDRLKSGLCDRFRVPLLRINRRYFPADFSNWDLLGWFTTVFFIKRLWDADVEAGKIPPDDSILDPMFVSVPTKSGFRSLELERRARSELGRMFQAGTIPSHMPNWITASGKNSTLRAISWIELSGDSGAVVETAMRQHNLGDWVEFAIRGIVLTLLHEQVSAILRGTQSPIPMSAIDSRVAEFESRHETIMALRCTSP
jgi:hypothetical protein